MTTSGLHAPPVQYFQDFISLLRLNGLFDGNHLRSNRDHHLRWCILILHFPGFCDLLRWIKLNDHVDGIGRGIIGPPDGIIPIQLVPARVKEYIIPRGVYGISQIPWFLPVPVPLPVQKKNICSAHGGVTLGAEKQDGVVAGNKGGMLLIGCIDHRANIGSHSPFTHGIQLRYINIQAAPLLPLHHW